MPRAGPVDGKERAFRDRTSIGAHGGAGDVDREVRGTHDVRFAHSRATAAAWLAGPPGQ